MSALSEFLINDEVADPSLPLLPAVVNSTELHQLDQAITEDGLFVREPHWNGLPTETGAIARLQQHKLVQALISVGRHRSARMVARLLDLLDCIVRLRAIDSADAASNRCGSSNLASGVGISWVETARGLLVHRVKGCIDLVNEYAIVAPTEWNFHPDGALSQSLLGSKIENEQKLKQHVAKECLGLDPCVAYEIEVIHA